MEEEIRLGIRHFVKRLCIPKIAEDQLGQRFVFLPLHEYISRYNCLDVELVSTLFGKVWVAIFPARLVVCQRSCHALEKMLRKYLRRLFSCRTVVVKRASLQIASVCELQYHHLIGFIPMEHFLDVVMALEQA